MDAIIERTQAMKAWLMQAQGCQCERLADCTTVTFDEAGDAMRVSLSCTSRE